MTQSELVDRLMKRMPQKSRMDVEHIVKVFFDAIVKALEKNHRVELRGFGSFYVKHRTPRVGCDPRTGKAINVCARYIPFFKVGKALNESLNS